MKTSYCISCGAKHNYSFSPPKFCSNCGENVDGVKKHTSKASSRVSKASVADEEIDEDSSDIDYLPDIDKIVLDIEHDQLMTHSLGSIVGQTQDAPRRFESRSFDLDQLKNSRARA